MKFRYFHLDQAERERTGVNNPFYVNECADDYMRNCKTLDEACDICREALMDDAGPNLGIALETRINSNTHLFVTIRPNHDKVIHLVSSDHYGCESQQEAHNAE